MKNTEAKISELLQKEGYRLFNSDKKLNTFTKNEKADELLNDLDSYPHAFVLACIMDKQVKAEIAWLVPYKLKKKINAFDITSLGNISLETLRRLMSSPSPLHRFPDVMSRQLYEAIKQIISEYNGDASKIWKGNPSSASVVYKFLQFQGAGPKIATMAANILARDFKIPLSDYYSIDISADVHIRRVFNRLGLIEKGASIEKVIYKARSLSPEFPGILDLPTWEIGRNWCKAKKPLCSNCFMKDVCQYAINII